MHPGQIVSAFAASSLLALVVSPYLLVSGITLFFNNSGQI
jgi:hypothetical protein